MKKLRASLILLIFYGFSTVTVAVGVSNQEMDDQNFEMLASLESQAAAGSDKAQMKLGIIYLEGRGVTADIDKALFYYRLAAEREIAFAQFKLAQIYLDGNHVKPDPEKALSWLLRAARHGFVRAQLDLSVLYENGTAVDQDMVKAHQWISIASSLTDMDLEPRKEELEEKMTFPEVAHAKLLSRICILNGYEGC